jgi:uncharacterized phage-like protein YoqJ
LLEVGVFQGKEVDIFDKNGYRLLKIRKTIKDRIIKEILESKCCKILTIKKILKGDK